MSIISRILGVCVGCGILLTLAIIGVIAFIPDGMRYLRIKRM